MSKMVSLRLLEMAMLDKISRTQANSCKGKRQHKCLKFSKSISNWRQGLMKGSDGQCNNGQYSYLPCNEKNPHVKIT